MEINERLFGLLAEIKDGQRRLAERLGITDQTISAWKSRKTDPPSKYISTIAEFLNVPVEYLLTGRENVKMETGTGKTANLVSLLNKLNESGILLVTGYVNGLMMNKDYVDSKAMEKENEQTEEEMTATDSKRIA